MPSVSAAAGTQQQLRLEAEPVATTFSAADTTAFLQASWKKAMERGAVRCIIAETAPNHEEEHKDWEAMIEAARQRNLDEEVPPPSSKPTNYWDWLPDELQDIIMRRARRLVIKRQIFVKGLTGQIITMSDVVLSNSVWVFKEQIAAKTGIPPANLRLVFWGRELKDRVQLQRYCVCKESTVINWFRAAKHAT